MSYPAPREPEGDPTPASPAPTGEQLNPGPLNILWYIPGGRDGVDGSTDHSDAFSRAIAYQKETERPIYAPNCGPGREYLVDADVLKFAHQKACIFGDLSRTRIAITGMGSKGLSLDGGAAATTVVPSAGADTLTAAGHGFETGDGPVRYTSSGTMPGGVDAEALYWLIRVDDDTLQLAESYAAAIGGSELDITSAGTGVHKVDQVIIGAYIGNLELIGNASVEFGYFVRNAHRLRMENLDGFNFATRTFYQCFGVRNRYVEPRCSVNEHAEDWSVVPSAGMYITNRLDDGGVADHSEATAIVDPTFEGIVGDGILLDACDTTHIEGGALEGNTGRGLKITDNGGGHTVDGETFFEENSDADIDCAGFSCSFQVLSQGLTRFSTGAYGNALVEGGQHAGVTNESTFSQRYDGCSISGDLNDPVTPQSQRRYFDQPSGRYTEGDYPIIIPAQNDVLARTRMDAMLGLWHADEAAGDAKNAIDNAVLTAAGTSTYRQWMDGRRGILLADNTAEFLKDDYLAFGTVSHVLVWLFGFTGHSADARGIWQSWDPGAGDGFGAAVWLGSDDKVWVGGGDGSGGHSINAFKIVDTAITFNDVYALILNMDRGATKKFRTRLINVTTKVKASGADQDITAHLTWTGAGQKYGPGPIANVATHSNGVVWFGGLHFGNSSQCEEAGAPAAGEAIVDKLGRALALG